MNFKMTSLASVVALTMSTGSLMATSTEVIRSPERPVKKSDVYNGKRDDILKDEQKDINLRLEVLLIIYISYVKK